jgi:hypothetical protein
VGEPSPIDDQPRFGVAAQVALGAAAQAAPQAVVGADHDRVAREALSRLRERRPHTSRRNDPHNRDLVGNESASVAKEVGGERRVAR